eukprot:1375497-Prymnesium_polylepis.1
MTRKRPRPGAAHTIQKIGVFAQIANHTEANIPPGCRGVPHPRKPPTSTKRSVVLVARLGLRRFEYAEEAHLAPA